MIRSRSLGISATSSLAAFGCSFSTTASVSALEAPGPLAGEVFS